jgi:hypothetical protein
MRARRHDQTHGCTRSQALTCSLDAGCSIRDTFCEGGLYQYMNYKVIVLGLDDALITRLLNPAQ